MSSFHKAADSGININGCKTRSNLSITSSGIPSLDFITGGGLPLGAIFAVSEDVLGTYSRVLSKYFLAEGIVCQHALFVVSADDNPQDIIKELPVNCSVQPDDEVGVVSQNVDKMKIAWRYEGLQQVESSFGASTNFGHHFDLSKHIDAETIENSNITLWTPCSEKINCNGFKNSMYFDLLSCIKRVLSNQEYQLSSKKRNVLRININNLGSPVWLAMECEDNAVDHLGKDLLKFLYCLRVLLRDTTAVAFVTLPTHLLEDDIIVKRLLYSIDNAVQIESFAGSSKETNPVYKDYHGLFHITKLSAVSSLVPYVPPSLDLAFKLKRKKFVIEKLHLPPELQESSEREQDDITAVPSVTCGGFRKKDIDF